MTTEAFLSRLERVKQTARDRWTARCPAHDDKGPSLAIRALEDGRTLAHCFAGCSIDEVVSATGLEISVLFPDGPIRFDGKDERRPYAAHDILACLALEATIAADCSRQLQRGVALPPADHARLVTACGRLLAGAEMASPGQAASELRRRVTKRAETAHA